MNFDELNATELAAHIRLRTGVIIKRCVSRERMVQLLMSGEIPAQEEWSGTMETRHSLQVFIEKNWTYINSQLPCKGENRGRCTIFPCTESRHVDCYTSNRDQLQVHSPGKP